MKDNFTYLQHILEAIIKIEKYLENVDFKQFKDNEMMTDAVVRKLEIIGEATNKLTIDFRNQYPDMPWGDIVGMRNRLIHDYFGVDIDLVWKTYQNNLPELKSLLLTV